MKLIVYTMAHLSTNLTYSNFYMDLSEWWEYWSVSWENLYSGSQAITRKQFILISATNWQLWFVVFCLEYHYTWFYHHLRLIKWRFRESVYSVNFSTDNSRQWGWLIAYFYSNAIFCCFNSSISTDKNAIVDSLRFYDAMRGWRWWW